MNKPLRPDPGFSRPNIGNDIGNNIGNNLNVNIGNRPTWSNRPGAVNVGNRWNQAVTRPGRPPLDKWYSQNPNRFGYWHGWADGVRHHWNYHHNDFYRPGWWGGHRHPIGGWHYYYYNTARPWQYWWTVPTFAGLTSWFTWTAPSSVWEQPIVYDYGSGGNVYYENNTVYVAGEQVGSSADFAASAAELATVEPPADEDEAEQAEWMPLGTFAITTDEDDVQPTRTVQLAVNKAGVVSGTLYNDSTDITQTVLGQVDKETQRVAMRIGESDEIVVETGLYNLTQDEAPMLVHYGTDETETWLLVRLDKPEDAEGADAPAGKRGDL